MKSFLNQFSFQRILIVVLWIIFIIPFVIYGLYIFKYAVNIPVMDDFDAVLNFTNAFSQAQTGGSKIAVLFSQHNEHRLVFDRIIFLCYYYLFHEVDFFFFIVFGNLGWILTTVMLVLYFRNFFDLSLNYLIPIPYMMLSFIHRDTMFFATPAIQFYWFMFFSVAFLICLSKDKPLLFCVLFPIALFTSGGGIVLYPLGILFLVLKKKWKSFAWFIVLSTACMVLYFFSYSTPINHPSIFEAVINPLRSIAYFFAFLGNLLPVNTIAIPIGIILCILSVYFVIMQPGDSFLRLAIGFVGLTALVTSFTRSGFGVEQARSARYTLFPLLALVCIYIYIVSSISRSTSTHKLILTCAVCCAMAYWGTGVIYSEYTHYFQKVKDERIASLVGLRNGEKERLLYPEKDRAAQLLLTAEQLHIYNYQDQLP